RVAPEGLESGHATPNGTSILRKMAPQGAAQSGAVPPDPDLARVMAAWPGLPEHVRRSVLLLIAAAAPPPLPGGPEGSERPRGRAGKNAPSAVRRAGGAFPDAPEGNPLKQSQGASPPGPRPAPRRGAGPWRAPPSAVKPFQPDRPCVAWGGAACGSAW